MGGMTGVDVLKEVTDAPNVQSLSAMIESCGDDYS